MKPICLSRKIRKEKIYDSGDLYLTRDGSNNIRVIPKTCPHLGFDLGKAKLKDGGLQVQCPYHNYSFSTLDPSCINVFDYQGLIWDYSASDSSWFEIETSLIDKVDPSQWRGFKFKTNYKNLLANTLDFEHLTAVHKWSTGIGLKDTYIVFSNESRTLNLKWDSFIPRNDTVKARLFKQSNLAVLEAPFNDDTLTTLSFAIPSFDNDQESILLINHFFNKPENRANNWLRFWTNRVVDWLVWEDQKILKHINTNKPSLKGCANPLIWEIYE